MLGKEVWKEYPLNYKHEGYYKVEFSNRGRIKTYNKLNPEGKIITGSIQGGYPILRVKLLKPRTKRQQSKLETIQNEVDDLNSKIKVLIKEAPGSEELAELRAQRDAAVQKRKAANKKINNTRAINVGILVHKAVAELFLPKPEDPEKKFIIHKDFDKTNNYYKNLDYYSQEQLNERYMKHPKNELYKFKRMLSDTKPIPSTSKLNENQVLTIKKRLKKGYTLRRLARQFGVSDMQIHRIKTGENWDHVKLIEDIIEEKQK